MLLTLGATTGKIVFSTLVAKAVNSVINSKEKKEEKNYITSYKTRLLIKLYEKISLLNEENISDSFTLIASLSNKLMILIDNKDFNEKLENYNFILTQLNTNEYDIDLTLINNEMKYTIKDLLLKI